MSIIGKPSFINGVNIPGIESHLAIAHSAIARCSESVASDIAKILEKEYADFFVDDANIIDGTTINVDFLNGNTCVSGTPGGPFMYCKNSLFRTPIIAKVLDYGIPDAEGVTGKEAVYAYPRWEANTIVTFVYRTFNICKKVDGVIQVVPTHFQQAINTIQVPDYRDGANDFNNYIYDGTHIIGDFGTYYNSFTTEHTDYGVLEVKRFNTYIIQTVTIQDGNTYKRFGAEANSIQGQSNWQQITATAISPTTPILSE